MKKTTIKTSKATCAAVLFGTASLSAQSVFTEDFSSTSILTNPNPYIGGWYGNILPFGAWTSNPSVVSLANEQLVITNTSTQIRTAGIVLNPTLFQATGAGTYTLAFDLMSFAIGEGSGFRADEAYVSVWQGSGYSNGGQAALRVNTEAGALEIMPGASVSESALGTYTLAGKKSLSFEYDGVSAVALFFGSESDGYPFSTTIYDNIELTYGGFVTTPIPEPSALLLISLSALGLLRRSR